GCFWCMQPPFDKAPGVLSTTVGFCGGPEKKPSYEMVSDGKTGHAESIRVVYDPRKISYETLIDIFWHNIDPTQTDGQFADRGNQYKTHIFYTNADQKRIADAAVWKLASSKKFTKPIATTVLPATEFWPAEEYHQKYYLKNPDHYHSYKEGSGRLGFIRAVWGTKE
ncbi:MAG: peptide-methionine (S)-S-oxide reductase MsrA, partial [Spirochaetia bacterium]|nr:peptide-methionine (S)-S-oxide reductase MsrA [Spirochaetia bacterium]